MNQKNIRTIELSFVRGRLVLALMLAVLTTSLRAQDQPAPIADADQTPYSKALLFYKIGRYVDAHSAINAAEQAKPGDPATEVLKARILTELRDFAGAKAALESINGKPGLTPEVLDGQALAFGDLCLRQRSFDEAAKFYETLLSKKPGDPDLILKIIYTRVGAGDMVAAAKYASQLKPFDRGSDPLDPKHPGNPSYYFAKAALAQATGKTAEADDDIQTARTLYGEMMTTRYLKTYLEVFNTSAKSGPASV